LFGLRIFPQVFDPAGVRLWVGPKISFVSFKEGNTMQRNKILGAGLFVIGLSIPALFSAPEVAQAQVIIIAPSDGYVRPLGGVRRAVRGVARAKVRRKVRRKIRKKIRRR
jgi:hypothetical protein